MAVQKTTNYNLQKPDKGTKDWDILVNQNMDTVDAELKRQKDEDGRLNTRIDTIVAQAGNDNTEIVDARASQVKKKTFPVLDGRIEENEAEVELALGLLQFESSGFNQDINGYTIVEYKTLTGVVRIKSELQTYDADTKKFTQRLVTVFEPDGVTVRRTQKFNLQYNADGVLFKETPVLA